MLSTTTWAWKRANPAILRSAVETSPRANTRSCPADAQLGGDVDEAVGRPRGRQPVPEVVADRRDAEAAEPHVGAHAAAGRGVDRERLEPAGRGRREGRERAVQQELHPEGVELRPQLGPQLGGVGAVEDVGGRVHDRDADAGERGADLAGELEPDRSRPDDERVAGTGQRRVALAEAGERLVGDLGLGLGRERVAGPGGEDDVVGRELLARREHDPVRRPPAPRARAPPGRWRGGGRGA